MSKQVTNENQEHERCVGKTKRGRCKARPMGDGEYCFFHDPDGEDKRQRARRRGAARTNGLKATPLSVKAPDGLRSIRDLMHLVEIILRGCIENDIDHKLANAMSGLIRVQASLIIDYDLETRVMALEASIEKETAHAHQA